MSGFCMTSKHLETKLNYQKHIKFYEFHQKVQERKIKKKIEFLTVFDTFGPYNQSQT